MPTTSMIELAPPQERAFLVAVDTGDEPRWSAEDSLEELAALAPPAGGRGGGRRVAEPPARRPQLVPRQGQGRGARAGQGRDGLHAARRRRRAEAEPAEGVRGAAEGQGARP